MSKEKYQTNPIPPGRRFALDAGRLGRRKHIVHGLAEVDVTVAREYIRDHEQRSGEKLSFTAFIINCLAQAIDRHRDLHAYKNWRGQLVIFEDVNIVTMIETLRNGKRIPMPYLLKAVNRKSYHQVHNDIRAAQSSPAKTRESSYMRWFLVLPWFLRRILYWVVLRVPHLFRDYSSSVMVTAVGMFSRGASWGITMPSFTLTVALGGISQKPGVIDGTIEIREFLHITVSVDHDIVDGAPIARFGNDLMDLIERGYGLIVEDQSIAQE